MGKQYWMYVSMWREHGGAPGLALYSVDVQTGSLTFCSQINDRISFGCSFVDTRRGILYVCNEDERVFGVPYPTGRIYGYKISPRDGSLTELFHQDTYCPNPAFISQDHSGRFLVAANHSTGGASVTLEKDERGEYVPRLASRDALLELFSVNEDGSLGAVLDVKKHKVDLSAPHVGSFLHSAVFSPSGNLVAVCDKGDGHVYLYALDSEKKELKLMSRTETDLPGSRSRYCVFHPTQPYFVVNHEQMQGERMAVSSFRYTEDGEVEKICSVNVLPENIEIPAKNHYEQQGLCISADGNYVYTCLNGPNAICVLGLDDASGELSVLQHIPVEGVWPRGLAMMPGGKFLVATCLVSGDIFTYEIQENGLLRYAGTAGKLKGSAYLSFCERELLC